MIHGATHWSDRTQFYIQGNNAVEGFLKKKAGSSWLESCGPSAAVNCIAAIGGDLEVKCPGSYNPQPEDTLFLFFNDPRNYGDMSDEYSGVSPHAIPANRVMQWYPLAVSSVFGAHAQYRHINGYELTQLLTAGQPVQILLRKPSHFIAAVAWDDKSRKVVYNDSWPERFPDGNGFNRDIDLDELMNNCEPYGVVYGGDK